MRPRFIFQHLWGCLEEGTEGTEVKGSPVRPWVFVLEVWSKAHETKRVSWEMNNADRSPFIGLYIPFWILSSKLCALCSFKPPDSYPIRYIIDRLQVGWVAHSLVDIWTRDCPHVFTYPHSHVPQSTGIWGSVLSKCLFLRMICERYWF